MCALYVMQLNVTTKTYVQPNTGQVNNLSCAHQGGPGMARAIGNNELSEGQL